MNRSRSYLDTLNAGRERRGTASIEDIGRSLDAIGARLERSHDDERRRPAARSDDRYRPMYDAPQDDLFPRDRERSAGGRHETQFTADRLAREVDTARRREEGVASAGRIAAELKAMREELRQQVNAGLQREFDSLRGEIERAWGGAAAGVDGSELNRELERLSAAIAALAERADDRGVELLRRELDEVKAALGHLASEDALRAVESRWDDFGRRFDAFEERYAHDAAGEDPAVAALAARLDDIVRAVDSLPESLSLRTLEDKVRTLAGSVDQFSRHAEDASPASFHLIEERLDEISRAIVASSLASQEQPLPIEQFERIEARIASLARQIDELADDRPAGEVIDRINHLSQRVDELARRADFPEQVATHLADQIAAISEKLDNGLSATQAGDVVRGLEDRFSSLSDSISRQQGEAMTHGQSIFRELEARLADLSARLDQPAPADGALIEAIDSRFAEMTRRFDEASARGGDGAMRDLEGRLDDITSRLDRSSREAAVDPDLIRSLEAQVSALSQHIARPQQPLPEFEDLSPKLEQIERAIADQRDTILESARLVAEETIARMSQAAQGATDPALAEDLRSIETLARRSDERNTRTFEAIHDTLIKIVDRLGAMERTALEIPRESVREIVREPAKPVVSDAPPLQPEADVQLAGDPMVATRSTAARATPAQAAIAAASAALEDEDAPVQPQPPQRKSMLAGLARKFRRSKDADMPAVSAEFPAEFMDAPVTPGLDLDDVIDPKLANRPLEPGSGAPDLNAIMKRVRDERGLAARPGDSDTAKADFIAAARRAAQAAAAEAETRKRGVPSSGVAVSSGLGRIFRNHRKAALMTVGGIVLALAGLQLGASFLSDGKPAPAKPRVAAEEPAVSGLPAAVEPVNAVVAPDAPVRAAVPTLAAAPAQVDDFDDQEIDEETVASLPEEMDLPEPAAAIVPQPAPVALAVPQDVGTPALREAAAASDPRAFFELGSRYADGRGVKTDLAEAARWYERAAEAGFAPAQYRIGNFYEKGTGVERDVAKAKTWYQLAAEQGNASAMHNLAVLFAMGADGTTDNDSAGRWFRRAADHGVRDSQFNLGILSAKGVGVAQDLEESYKWFSLVAQAGDKDASQKRDEVAKALRPEQLARARSAAELWKPKPLDADANDLSVPPAWSDAPRTASVDMKQAVRTIQLILNKNGYDAGGADGVMGQKTRNAIVSFQKDNGLPATGEVSEDLVKALLAKG